MDLSIIKEAVCQIAPAYPVLSVDMFGSYANHEETDQSDVDLLVCFDEKKASLFDLSGLRFDIQDKLNKDVDVVAGPLGSDSLLMIKNKVRLYAQCLPPIDEE